MIRGPARTAAAATLALVLAGCLDVPVPTPAPTPTATPEPTPTTTVYELGATVWYEGLVIQFHSATATLDARGGPVDVRLTIDNPNGEDSSLDGEIRLVVAGDAISATRDSVLPTVPAQGGVQGLLRYELQGIPNVDDAVIEVGALPEHVARVPLTAAGGDTVAFQPVAVDVSGTATAAAMRITLVSGLLRWDLPDWSQELTSDLQALTLTYDVGYTGDFAGGLAFTGENVALRLPDGTVVTSRRDGHSQSVELIGPRKTKKALFSRFEIPAGVTGEFALLVRNGGTERAIVFTIEG